MRARLRRPPLLAEPPGGGFGHPERRILIVDDLPEMCDLLRVLLARIGHPRIGIVTETNAERALELVRTKTFDLVISDQRMPQVSGVEILEAAHDFNPEGRRVLITAYDEVDEPGEKVQRAQLDAFVRKPVGSQEIVQLVLDVLGENPEALATARIRVREVERTLMAPPEADGPDA